MAYPTATYRAAYRGERSLRGRVQRTALGTLVFGLSAVAAAGAIMTSLSIFSSRSNIAFRSADPSLVLAKALPAPTVFAIAHRSQFPAADEIAAVSTVAPTTVVARADATGSPSPVSERFPHPSVFLPLVSNAVKTVSFVAPRSQEVQLPEQHAAAPLPVGKPAAIKASLAAKSDMPAMFKRDEPTTSPTVSSYALASAPPEASPTAKAIGSIKALFSPGVDEGPIPEADKRTAVYDITTATVHMPDGSKLVAHSGYAHRMDNPKFINVKNWGPTPPNVYRLTLREALFHGVQAIRLNPIDESKMMGRDGMLAHTYMLGPRGDSNGCISFQDYPKFLRAFQRGEVDRVVVVTDLKSETLKMARAKGRLVETYASAR